MTVGQVYRQKSTALTRQRVERIVEGQFFDGAEEEEGIAEAE